MSATFTDSLIPMLGPSYARCSPSPRARRPPCSTPVAQSWLDSLHVINPSSPNGLLSQSQTHSGLPPRFIRTATVSRRRGQLILRLLSNARYLHCRRASPSHTVPLHNFLFKAASPASDGSSRPSIELCRMRQLPSSAEVNCSRLHVSSSGALI